MKSVAITGFAPSSRDEVYNLPEDTEIWCLNEGFTWLKQSFIESRNCRWFQMHDKGYLFNAKLSEDELKRNKAAWEWLKQQTGFPVYIVEEDPDMPHAKRFPIDELIEHFGRDYFTSTPAYMAAFALYEGFEHIYMPGIDLSSAGEYGWERPCYEYWLGRCEQAGVTLNVPDSSPVLKGFRYGATTDHQNALANMARTRAEDTAEKAMATWSRFMEMLGRFRECQMIFQHTNTKSPGYQSLKQRHNFLAGQVNSLQNTLQLHLGSLRSGQHWASTMNVLTPKMMIPELVVPEELGVKLVGDEEEPEFVNAEPAEQREPEVVGAAD